MLGKKSGKGFYLYPDEGKKGKKDKGPRQLNPEALAIVKKHTDGKEAKLSNVRNLSHPLASHVRTPLHPALSPHLRPGSSPSPAPLRRRSRTGWCPAS
jgi:hypothetical protein